MSELVLMIEDDARLAAMVVDYLGRSGYAVVHAGTAAEGRAQLQRQSFGLVILDLMLPDADGLEVCKQIRSGSGGADLPIVMLTAKGDPLDRVIGLELGADDYLAKPFEPRELLARIRAVLRRTRAPAAEHGSALHFGRLAIDPGARSVRIGGEERTLTAYQFDLLLAMAERAGRVLTREQLLDTVKGESLEAFDRSIDVHIARIRAAIEDDAKKPKRIVTVRGAGYVFAKVQDA
ncbi:MAG TPA: response regulator transcription factor [Burkholderiales bacterium]|jgi:DNA-binding response OmpR family regulator|nr:response regulator transcription factor [Burkholderiales bacterium]